ncbi:MAG TPA: hypothetical protein VHE81_16775 [Lacipirellulaceae bacterium]|nr:hypothetical protein [Lacipirellulaceae bacterium]
MPRFVLLYHDCPPNYERPSHWDLMLESGDALRTWALDRLPRGWSAARARTAASFSDCPATADDDSVPAVQLGDHRRDYLELEGPLSGNRGAVQRMNSGTYHSQSESPDVWRVALSSGELSGLVTLSRSNSDNSRWVLEYCPIV